MERKETYLLKRIENLMNSCSYLQQSSEITGGNRQVFLTFFHVIFNVFKRLKGKRKGLIFVFVEKEILS
jgi:hypothetical protein